MTEGTVGDVGDTQLSGRVDEAVLFVEGLERGVLGLDGVNLGDCNC